MAIIKISTNNKCWRACGEREHLHTVGGNASWCNHYGKEHGVSLKELKIELSYDPEIPLPEKMKSLIQKDRCNTMFTEALFLIAE